MSTSGSFWEAFLTRHGVSFPASGAAANMSLTLSKAVKDLPAIARRSLPSFIHSNGCLC